jgi:hypothetical protein
MDEMISLFEIDIMSVILGIPPDEILLCCFWDDYLNQYLTEIAYNKADELMYETSA